PDDLDRLDPLLAQPLGVEGVRRRLEVGVREEGLHGSRLARAIVSSRVVADVTPRPGRSAVSDVRDPATDPRVLLGEWEFDRTVTDHLAGEVIGVVGRADFTLESDGVVRWAEQGTMTRAGVEIP